MSRSNLGRGSQSYLKKSTSASSPFRGNEFYPYSHVFKQTKSYTFLKLNFLLFGIPRCMPDDDCYWPSPSFVWKREVAVACSCSIKSLRVRKDLFWFYTFHFLVISQRKQIFAIYHFLYPKSIRVWV